MPQDNGRDAAIAKVEAMDLSRLQHIDDDTPPPDDAPEETEGQPVDEGTDQQPDETEDEPAEQGQDIDAIRAELADLKAMIAGNGDRATTRGRDGEPPVGTPSAPATNKAPAAFSKVRAKIEAAREEWGPVIDALGFAELLDELEPQITAIQGLAASAKTAEQRAEQERVKAMGQAVATVNTWMDQQAKTAPELARAIGQTAKTATKTQTDLRKAILDEAYQLQQQRQRLVNLRRAKDPLSDEDALAQAAELVAGVKIKPKATEQAVAGRARMVTPTRGRPGGTDTLPAPAQARARVEANVNDWLKQRGAS